MLDSYFLIEAMNGIPDKYVTMAGEMLGYMENKEPTHFRRKLLSTLLVAAIIVSLLTGAAYALGLFRVVPGEMKSVPEKEQTWIFMDSDGNEVERWVGDDFANGFCFRFSGEEAPHRVEFRAGWLPQEPTFWYPDPALDPYSPEQDWSIGKELWLEYLLDERQSETDFFPEPGIHDVGIPYMITVEYAQEDNYLIFNGKCKILKHEYWGDYEVYEVYCEKEIHLAPGVTDRELVISPENYVVLFSLNEGFVITVGGTSDMEILERIARDLEVRTTDEVVDVQPGVSLTLNNIVLG